MKKTTAKTSKVNNKKVSGKNSASANCPVNCCSMGHKIWGAVALAGLFACGLILGLSYRGEEYVSKKLSAQECDAIATEIVNITQRGATAENVETLNELNMAYSNGCAGRLVIIEKEPVISVDNRPEIMSTCARIEQLLKDRLYPEDTTNYIHHLRNADTYSSLADRGCVENADMYKTLALRELEIANALQPTENMGTQDAEIVIDTFKKLDMQQEAREFLNKVEQLIDPATDFVLKMEQIINE